jgi:hypothetical protein
LQKLLQRDLLIPYHAWKKTIFQKHYVDPELQPNNFINTDHTRNLIKNDPDQENKADRL